jgi:hypothetical protein
VWSGFSADAAGARIRRTAAAAARRALIGPP